jgi:hypothetical protein
LNKLAVIILSVFFVFPQAYAQGTLITPDLNDDELIARSNEIMVEIDKVKSKKEKVKIYEKFADMFLSQGHYDFAASIYLFLLDENPKKRKKAEYYIRLGDIAAIRHSYSEGLDYYKSAQSLYKKNVEIKAKIGDILLESNLYGLAEQSFNEILSLDKHSNYAKRKLGDIYFNQSLYSKASEYYKEINQSYHDKDIVVNLAICYRSLNKVNEAVKLVNNFLNIQKDSDLYLLSGLLYTDLGIYRKAEERFLLSIAHDDKNFAAYVYLAAIYLESGEIDKAENMLNKAGNINSYSSSVDMMHARISYKKQRLYEARRYAHNAILKAKTSFVKEQAQRMLDFFNEIQ